MGTFAVLVLCAVAGLVIARPILSVLRRGRETAERAKMHSTRVVRTYR